MSSLESLWKPWPRLMLREEGKSDKAWMEIVAFFVFQLLPSRNATQNKTNFQQIKQITKARQRA